MLYTIEILTNEIVCPADMVGDGVTVELGVVVKDVTPLPRVGWLWVLLETVFDPEALVWTVVLETLFDQVPVAVLADDPEALVWTVAVLADEYFQKC